MLPLQLTLQRFDRKQAEFLAELLINYGTNPNSESVSYTHLDVYKRQILKIAIWVDPMVLFILV